MKHLEMKAALGAQVWIEKEVICLGKDTSKPIRFKTIQKNTKLGEFVAEEAKPLNLEEQQSLE